MLHNADVPVLSLTLTCLINTNLIYVEHKSDVIILLYLLYLIYRVSVV